MPVCLIKRGRPERGCASVALLNLLSARLTLQALDRKNWCGWARAGCWALHAGLPNIAGQQEEGQNYVVFVVAVSVGKAVLCTPAHDERR